MDSSKKEIYTALVKAINELQNPNDPTEEQHSRINSVPLLDIIELAKPVLLKHGLAVLQYPVVMYEIGDNNMERAVVKITSTLIYKNGDSIEFPPVILKSTEKNSNSPQSVGNIITYGRHVDVKSIFTLFARFLFTLLLKKCFSGFSSDDYPHLLNHV